MSHENVIGFMEKILSDDGLQSRVAELRGDGGPDSVRLLLQIAADAGYPFTEQEMDDLFLARAIRETGAELTEEQLEAVAGGTEYVVGGTMDEMNTSFDVQYLAFQDALLHENREFTMVSNIMKNKHDAAKSSINNIR